MVPEEGLEPSRPYGRRFLKPVRLPIPPLRRGVRSMPLLAHDSRRGFLTTRWQPWRPCYSRKNLGLIFCFRRREKPFASRLKAVF